MKTVLPLTIAALCFSFHSQGQTNSLMWRGNNIPVVFEDQSLTAPAKIAIVSDMQNCFIGWATNAEIRLVSSGEVTNYIYYGTRTPYYPEGIDFPQYMVPSQQGLALQVPQKLSDAYTNAFAFAAANSNAVAAAYGFVAFVSSTNFASLSSNVWPNYVLEKNTTSDEIVSSGQRIMQGLRNMTFYPPSILGFTSLDIGPSATNLWLYVPCSSPLSYSNEKEWSHFPAVWHDGRWKFCVWQE